MAVNGRRQQHTGEAVFEHSGYHFSRNMGLAAAAAEKAAYEKGGYAGLIKYKFMMAYRYMKTNCCCA
ncbi:hypothetical protein IV203_033834 [Nitzschia inconspicua]|uniref:Uncharacterized protein n=1 Tax=Nitzschia inconspicua TaxID=303405 RepID=A0A9K3M4H4_9STRA|nr:hypothetical protein IV203_033834 [Nitzschia inconspicua]